MHSLLPSPIDQELMQRCSGKQAPPDSGEQFHTPAWLLGRMQCLYYTVSPLAFPLSVASSQLLLGLNHGAINKESGPTSHPKSHWRPLELHSFDNSLDYHLQITMFYISTNLAFQRGSRNKVFRNISLSQYTLIQSIILKPDLPPFVNLVTVQFSLVIQNCRNKPKFSPPSPRRPADHAH